MIICDFHNHTDFSADCETPAEKMIEKAIELGLSYLCITDHMDPDMQFPGMDFTFDLEEYFTSNGICVCEWPYNIEEILPSEYLKIDIYREEADKRRFELTPIGNRYEQIVRDLNA